MRVACAGDGFLDFCRLEMDGGITSFSLPFEEDGAREISLGGRLPLAWPDLSFDFGNSDGSLEEVAPTDSVVKGEVGLSLSFLAGLARAIISSSSSSDCSLEFAAESLSTPDRCRWALFACSIAITSWSKSWEPSSTYGGGGTSMAFAFRGLGFGGGNWEISTRSFLEPPTLSLRDARPEVDA